MLMKMDLAPAQSSLTHLTLLCVQQVASVIDASAIFLDMRMLPKSSLKSMTSL